MSFNQNREMLETKGYKYYKNIETSSEYWVKGLVVISIDSLKFNDGYFRAFLEQKEKIQLEVR